MVGFFNGGLSQAEIVIMSYEKIFKSKGIRNFGLTTE